MPFYRDDRDVVILSQKEKESKISLKHLEQNSGFIKDLSCSFQEIILLERITFYMKRKSLSEREKIWEELQTSIKEKVGKQFLIQELSTLNFLELRKLLHLAKTKHINQSSTSVLIATMVQRSIRARMSNSNPSRTLGIHKNRGMKITSRRNATSRRVHKTA